MLTENINVQNAAPQEVARKPATRMSTRRSQVPPTNDYDEEPEESSKDPTHTDQTFEALQQETPTKVVETPAVSPAAISELAEPSPVSPAVISELAEPSPVSPAVISDLSKPSPVSPVANSTVPAPMTEEATSTKEPTRNPFYTEQFNVFCKHLDSIPALEHVETLTGKPRSMVVGSALGVLMLALALSGALAYLVNDLGAFWFPAALTLTSLTAATSSSNDTDASDAIYWGKYWVVFASLRMVVDPVCSTAVWMILGFTLPYDVAKMALLIWCMMSRNQTSGASLIFEKVHAPVVSKALVVLKDMKTKATSKLAPLLVNFGITKSEKSE